MNLKRCPNCRTLTSAEHRFCFVCGTPLGSAAAPGARLPGAMREASADEDRSTKTLIVLGAVAAIGIAKGITHLAPHMWPLAALLGLAGLVVIVWQSKARKEGEDGGQAFVGALGTVLLWVSVFLVVGVGLLMLLVLACFKVIGGV